MRTCKELGLDVIPLVQTFGHMEFILKHELFSNLRDVAEMPESDIPEYISDAAELISAALNYEAVEDYESSLSSYRSAIGKLLSSVQDDPDTSRQAQVKRRIAQYISKAEQLGKVF